MLERSCPGNCYFSCHRRSQLDLVIKVLAWGYSLVVELLPNKLKSLGSISLTANRPSSVHSRLGQRKALSRVTLEKFLTP